MENNQITGCGHEIKLYSLDKRNMVVQKMYESLLPHSNEFDAFAIQGYSSSMIAPILAHMMQKNIVLVRKQSENRHSSYESEGMHNQRCVFLDDLISCGDTFNRVIEGCQKLNCKVVGFALYESWACWFEGFDSKKGGSIPYWGIPKGSIKNDYW